MFAAFLLFLAIAPDRPALPDEWGYRPADAATVRTNPPSVSWTHERDAARYDVQWASEPSFSSPSTAAGLRWSVYTHSAPLSPGVWYWRYRIVDAKGNSSVWSRTRSFTAPPGSPDMGIGDLSFRPPNSSWSFMRYFATRTGNPHWTWRADQWKVERESGEPVLAFLWSAAPPVSPRPPTGLPQSKVFDGTGIAILNTTLLTSADNVQVRFKSSPMGRWSHGHDPHNSFTVSAFGVPLLVNNVYRDLYGSPFHKDWVWSARAQNAVLVNGEGQKPHSADLGGRIVRSKFEDGFDYVLGDATGAYEGRLTRAHRHILFIKPDIILVADDLAAPAPSTFQYMLHGQGEFQVDEQSQRLVLDRGQAGVVVDYAGGTALKMRQWTGYAPEPDHRYLASIKSPGIPPQWHVEASSTNPSAVARTLTIIRPYRSGNVRTAAPRVTRGEGSLDLEVEDVTVRFAAQGPNMAEIRRGGKTWRVER